MNAIAQWIANNPYLTAAGLFATFLGLIIAIVTPIFQKKRKQLYYTVSTTQLVEEKVSKIDGVEILFHGSYINRLSVSNVRIWNSGNTIITVEDFYNKHKLQVIPTGDFEILGADTPKESADIIESSVTTSNNVISISFQAFEKKDYISFNVYHTGNEKDRLLVDGRIKDGKIIDKTFDTEVELNLVGEFTRLSLISIVPFGPYIWLCFELVGRLFKQAKNKKPSDLEQSK